MRYSEIQRRPWRKATLCTLGSFFLIALMLTGTSAMAREKPLDILYASADTDGNGLISEAEWHAAMQKRFETLDANGDGNISKEEMANARETARDKFRALSSHN